MKNLKFIVILLLCFSIILSAVFAINKSKSNKDDNSTSSNTDSSSQSISTDIFSSINSGISSDITSESETISQDSNETDSLPSVNTNGKVLSKEKVTWGPGTIFNDDNQPTACVSLQEKYGDLGAVFLNNNKKIYLTFDLGYESGFTNDILDALKENNAKATFFLTGSYASKNEDIIQRIIDEGHTVGNHSFSHPDMTTISDEECKEEIMKVHNIIKDKYNYESYLFRFPAGTFSENTLAVASECGYHSVFWSFAYNDWDNKKQPDVQTALTKVTDRLHPGAIYLLHPMETNSKILSDFIKTARSKGYEIGVL